MTANNQYPFAPVTYGSPAPDACALRVENLTKHYADFTLDDVSLDVPYGSVVGLVGRNGAGKTTLMKCILGATLPDSGRVELFGTDVATLDSDDLARLRARVAYVGATIAYPQTMRVREVRRLYELAYPAFDGATFERLCQQLALDSPRAKVHELSRGMGMKLQLACALSCGAQMLVLDEPTAGLDPIVRNELLDILRVWMEDDRRNILISSHITSDLEHLADYLVMIEGGSVVLSCEQDVIGEVMGIANLRTEELRRVLDDGFLNGTPARVLQQGLSWALLVPDRAAFQRAYPSYVCDPASIDDIMTLIVKGEVR